jgi:toxin ParE1/3/4
LATLVLAARVGGDLHRIRSHLAEHEAADVDARIDELIEALQLLTRHPLIGRKLGANRRELVIGRGARGYVALYAFDPLDDVVVVGALRAQREAGFGEG